MPASFLCTLNAYLAYSYSCAPAYHVSCAPIHIIGNRQSNRGIAFVSCEPINLPENHFYSWRPVHDHQWHLGETLILHKKVLPGFRELLEAIGWGGVGVAEALPSSRLPDPTKAWNLGSSGVSSAWLGPASSCVFIHSSSSTISLLGST